VPGYNAYSPDGDVTAELVYVNKGLPRDYERLKQLRISVAGKTALLRTAAVIAVSRRRWLVTTARPA